MGTRWRIGGSAAIVVAASLVVAATASAQQYRAAVAPFEGRQASAVRREVARAAADVFDVSPRARTRRAALRAGVSGVGPDGVSALAEALGADLVIQGEVAGRGRRARVVVVTRAADGTELRRAELESPRGRAGRRAFRAEVGPLLVASAQALSAHLAPEPDPEPPPVVRPDEVEPPPPERPADGLAVLSGTLGLVGRTRDADVELLSGGRRAYASGLYPELRVAVEARPLANDPGLARGLFLRGSFAHSLGLGSQTEGGGAAVDSTNFLRVDGDVGFLFGVDALEIGLAFGLGYDGYHLAPNPVLASAEYLYLRPGARARIRALGTELLVIGVDLGYRATLSRGAISAQLGADGDTHGVDLGVSVGGNLLADEDLGFTWGAGFTYVGYFLGFGGLASDSPGDSGVEHAVRFRAELGWSFR